MPGQEKDRVPYIYPMAGSSEPPHMEEEGPLPPPGLKNSLRFIHSEKEK